MTTQSGEAQRVRSYLQSQGNRYTCTELWVRLIKARISVIDAVDGVTQAQADFRPDPFEWSISEVLRHLIASSERVAEMVAALSRGEPFTTGRIDPPREEASLTIEQLTAYLREDSISWSALTERLPLSPPTEPTAPHPFFGELHARAWYLFQRVHDLDHADQINKNKQATGFPRG